MIKKINVKERERERERGREREREREREKPELKDDRLISKERNSIEFE